MKIKILHKTPKGFLIGRGYKEVKIGSVVISNNKKIGKVIDIFGPVSNPYIKIKPTSKNLDFCGVVYVKNHKFKYKNIKKKN